MIYLLLCLNFIFAPAHAASSIPLYLETPHYRIDLNQSTDYLVKVLNLETISIETREEAVNKLLASNIIFHQATGLQLVGLLKIKTPKIYQQLVGVLQNSDKFGLQYLAAQALNNLADFSDETYAQLLNIFYNGQPIQRTLLAAQALAGQAQTERVNLDLLHRLNFFIFSNTDSAIKIPKAKLLASYQKLFLQQFKRISLYQSDEQQISDLLGFAELIEEPIEARIAALKIVGQWLALTSELMPYPLALFNTSQEWLKITELKMLILNKIQSNQNHETPEELLAVYFELLEDLHNSNQIEELCAKLLTNQL